MAVSGANQNDWLRIRLTMDFTANGGDGLGDVSYINLSAGDTIYTSVAGLQDLALNMAGVDATAFDTLSIRTDLNRPQAQIDNLTVAVPELSSGLLVLVGALGLFARRRVQE